MRLALETVLSSLRRLHLRPDAVCPFDVRDTEVARDLAFFGFAHQRPYGLAKSSGNALQGRYLEILAASFDAAVVSAVHLNVVRKSFLCPFLLLTVLADDAGDAVLQGGACGSHQPYFTAGDLQSQAP